MSAHKSVKDLPEDGEKFDIKKVSKLLGMLFSVGILTTIACAVIFLNQEWRATMAYSWLFAFIFFFTLALGGLFWTLLHNATNSGWGVAVRRLMENLGLMLPWLFVFALPFVVIPDVRGALWEWMGERREMISEAEDYAASHLETETAEWEEKVREARARFSEVRSGIESGMAKATPGEKAFLQEKLDAETAAFDALKSEDAAPTVESIKAHHMKESNVLLYNKGGFLNMGFWFFRFIAYFVILTLLIRFLRGLSVRQDADGDEKRTMLARRMSCGFLPLFAVVTTFAVIDWLMCLDYTWFSTMWGVYLFAGSALSSMAVLVLVLTYLRNLGYLRDVVTEEHYHIMGKLMHAFVIFWAYISFSQYFLIWYANITEETRFFLMRNTGHWNTVSILLVVCHFFIPFLALLQKRVKTTPRLLCAVSLWMIAMHIIDMYWIVIPERGPSLGAGVVVPGAIFFDVLAFTAVGALLAYIFLRSLGKDSLYPCRDPRLEESINLMN